VDISAALTADLALLTQALDDSGIDLEAGLRAFTADVKLAVASFTGMTMTIALAGHEVSFTVHDEATIQPATSLLIPLAIVTPTDAASTLLLYAATPGAFVDLAADLIYALRIEPTALVLDGHFDPSAGSAGLTGAQLRPHKIHPSNSTGAAHFTTRPQRPLIARIPIPLNLPSEAVGGQASARRIPRTRNCLSGPARALRPLLRTHTMLDKRPPIPAAPRPWPEPRPKWFEPEPPPAIA